MLEPVDEEAVEAGKLAVEVGKLSVEVGRQAVKLVDELVDEPVVELEADGLFVVQVF